MQIVKRTDHDVEINLLGVLQLFWHRSWVIIFACLLGAAMVFAGLWLFVTPEYTASITLYVNNSASNDNTSITQSDLSASAKLVDTYSAIISSSTVLEQVIQQAGLENITAEDLDDMLSISAVNETEVFTVSISHEDPGAAALVANTIADVAPEQIADIVEGSSVKVIAYAKIPSEISSPSYLKLTIVGAVIGFVVSCAFILVRELVDSTLKSEADLEGFGLPVLCVMPEFDLAGKMDGYGYAAGKRGGKK